MQGGVTICFIEMVSIPRYERGEISASVGPNQLQ